MTLAQRNFRVRHKPFQRVQLDDFRQFFQRWRQSGTGAGRTAYWPGVQKRPWLSWLACVACLAIFAGMQFDVGPVETVAERWGWQTASQIYDGAYWALFTSAFIHSDILHLAFDVFWIAHLGRRFETTVGSGKWLAFVASAYLVTAGAQLSFGSDTGLGLSGAGCALGSFMWTLRRQVPAFADRMGPKSASVFLIWLVACLVATLAGVVNVGNIAHIAGLAFGAAVGAWVGHLLPKPVALGTAALLLVGSIGCVLWAPWSPHWTFHQGNVAYQREDYATAVQWYERSRELGQNPEWCRQHIELTLQIMNRPGADRLTNSSSTPRPTPGRP